MSLGLTTTAGRILTARLLKGDVGVTGITHCALGSGDMTFTDPLHPPDPTVDQIGLWGEFARKVYERRSFLIEDLDGTIIANSVHYRELAEDEGESKIIGIFFRFEETEGNGHTIKEYGFFGGTVAYTEDVEGGYAEGGIFDTEANPDGQVLDNGYLYEVTTIADFNKNSDTRLELVGIIKI